MPSLLSASQQHSNCRPFLIQYCALYLSIPRARARSLSLFSCVLSLSFYITYYATRLCFLRATTSNSSNQTAGVTSPCVALLNHHPALYAAQHCRNVFFLSVLSAQRWNHMNLTRRFESSSSFNSPGGGQSNNIQQNETPKHFEKKLSNKKINNITDTAAPGK